MDQKSAPVQPVVNPVSPGTPVGVLVFLAISVSSWLFYGAIGYSQWAIDSGLSGNMKYDGTFVLNCYLQLIALGFLVACAYTTWPRATGGFVVSGAVGLGVATLYTAFYGFSVNSFQTLFCANSGVYVGILFEYLTGLCRRLVAHMEASSKAHHENFGIEPALLADNIEAFGNSVGGKKKK